MKNSLADLVNHQFMMLERLGDLSLKGEELAEEITRAKAVSEVAGTMIQTTVSRLTRRGRFMTAMLAGYRKYWGSKNEKIHRYTGLMVERALQRAFLSGVN